MTDIGPGTKVVFLGFKNQRCGYGDERRPTKGQVYTVRAIVGPPTYRRTCFLLAEIRNRPRLYSSPYMVGVMEFAFAAKRFRPIDDTDHSESMELLRKIADTRKVRVDA